MGVAEYEKVISSTAPRWLRAAIIVAWRRMARVGDIAELRQGDLWTRSRDSLWLAQSFHKSAAAGAYDRVAIYVNCQELKVLAPWVACGQPESHPLARGLLFPGLTASLVADTILQCIGRRVGAHAIRRSALRAAVDGGVPLPTAILLSLHKDQATALAYSLFPDVQTADAMRLASAATTSVPHPSAPLRAQHGF